MKADCDYRKGVGREAYHSKAPKAIAALAVPHTGSLLLLSALHPVINGLLMYTAKAMKPANQKSMVRASIASTAYL